MPEIARKNSTDTVASPDGAGPCCGFPSTQTTNQGSNDVFINNVGAVRLGDAMISHSNPIPFCCASHAPTLSSCSSTVFINGKGVGRKGDVYGGNHTITSGSNNVFAG